MKKFVLLVLLCSVGAVASAERDGRGGGDGRWDGQGSLRQALRAVESAKSEASYLSSRYRVNVDSLNNYLWDAQSAIRDAMRDDGGGGGRPDRRIEMFYSDSCSGDLIGYAGPRTNCDVDYRTGSVWGIRVDGVCYNIADTSAAKACKAFQNFNSRALLIYNSDSCSRDLIAAVDYNTDCESLRGMAAAWGIKRGTTGTCDNIQDMDIVEACRRFR